jgi:hypothetical protein
MAVSFKAVNDHDRNFTRAKMQRRRAQLEQSVARYLGQLDAIDLQEPSEELAIKTEHLKEKLAKLESELQRLAAMERLDHQRHGLACRAAVAASMHHRLAPPFAAPIGHRDNALLFPIARCIAGDPPAAISCLAASPTHSVRARGCRRHAGVRIGGAA